MKINQDECPYFELKIQLPGDEGRQYFYTGRLIINRFLAVRLLQRCEGDLREFLDKVLKDKRVKTISDDVLLIDCAPEKI